MKFYDGDLSEYIEQYNQSKLYTKCFRASFGCDTVILPKPLEIFTFIKYMVTPSRFEALMA